MVPRRLAAADPDRALGLGGAAMTAWLYAAVLVLLLLPAALPARELSLLAPAWHLFWRAATVVSAFGLAWTVRGRWGRGEDA
jgi:hypothetical protein